MGARPKRIVCAIVLAQGLAAAALAALESGRVFDPERRLLFSVSVGEVATIDGFVEETTRRLFEVSGEPTTDNAEAFSFSELGIESSDTTIGLSLEYLWKYVTLEFGGSFMRADAQGIASRDFYIGVNHIDFNGRDYDYQVILQGTSYEANLDAALIGVKTSFTPVTLNPGGALQFMPSVHLGLFGFTGDFEVDAGPATGIQEYELPVREYVQNGRGRGDVTAFVPELGIGGELKMRLRERRGRRSSLVVEGGFSVFDFQGSTSDLGISSRNEKDLSVEYESVFLGLRLEWPWTSAADFVLGAQFRSVTADAESKAMDRPLEQTLVLREKFDKEINLEIETIDFLLGVRW